MYKKSLLDDE